jgi:hypothetical protein
MTAVADGSMLLAMLKTIRDSWGWTGLEPAAVIASNDFGNVVVKAADGAYWRICPEALTCELIAQSDSEFGTVWASNDFQRDWQMTRLVEIASATLGQVDAERCYCLKVPSVLGGEYDAKNLGTIFLLELLSFSGFVAQQINDLPDGATAQFRL